MTFLTPWMLLGALAAGIPIAIHFLFRSRYRTVPWAAMKFLLTAVEQTSRRLKFQELLLLLLRMAVLILLALAFARPISTMIKGAGRGEAVDAVFVFDVSYSMAARDGAQSRLERAKEEAIKIIEELPPHSTVQIITSWDNNKADVGPRSPGNLDQAKLLVQNLDVTHRTTDLATGVIRARDVLTLGQASNKELYLLSDMQKMGFEKEADKLKTVLTDIKEKAVVHLVKCAKRDFKNVAIVGITPQTGIPRPGERVGFAVLVKNAGGETVENLDVTLTVDGAEKGETAKIRSLGKGETRAVTVDAKLEKAGLRVLTAKVSHDELDADNRFDHVIQVREQVNILVVDGNWNEKDPEKASSYHLMHSLLPVPENQRATYKYNPRVVSARLASAANLERQDVCILVNCALAPKAGVLRDVLPGHFIEALDKFVRKPGHGVIIFSGDNVQPDDYNKILGKKYGLLPMPLKPAIKSPGLVPFFINRDTFGAGPPSYWNFKREKHYEIFDAVPVWQHLDLDEESLAKKPAKKDDVAKEKEKQDKDAKDKKDDMPPQVIVRLSSNKPLAVAKKVDAGEVVFVTTAAQKEGRDAKTGIPGWTIFNELPPYLYFLDATVAYLAHGQAQSYNLQAGDMLKWYPTDKLDSVYNLVHPDGKVVRLGTPEKVKGRHVVTTAAELPRAGVYRMTVQSRGAESVAETIDPAVAAKIGTPIAVIPDLAESAELTTFANVDVERVLGFTPVYIIAGEGAVSSGTERLNREWTVWALLAVLALVLLEVAFAWWCGRAW